MSDFNERLSNGLVGSTVCSGLTTVIATGCSVAGPVGPLFGVTVGNVAGAIGGFLGGFFWD